MQPKPKLYYTHLGKSHYTYGERAFYCPACDQQFESIDEYHKHVAQVCSYRITRWRYEANFSIAPSCEKTVRLYLKTMFQRRWDKMIADEIKKKEEEEEMKRQQHLQIQKFLKEEEKERKRTLASLKSHQRDSKSRISKAISMLVTDKRDVMCLQQV